MEPRQVERASIAVGFLLFGFIFLFSIESFMGYIEFIWVGLSLFALLFIFGGLTILIKAIVREYPVTKVPGRFQYLSEEGGYFFSLEFAKIIGVIILTPFTPLGAFALFAVLDCLDGWCLPYAKRVLLLRHKIDKLTDLLCQIPLLLILIQLLPQLAYYFLFFFGLTCIKTLLFLVSGNRDILIYLPSVFLFLSLSISILFTYFPDQYLLVFETPYKIVIFTAVILTVSVLYEIIYNGILCRLRYSTHRGGEIPFR